MEKSDDATMDAAFAAFWVNAERYADAAAYTSLRQAFKNGAAFPLARGKMRGEAALDQLATQDEARSLQEAWPWIVMNREAHPEWGETHLHALLADLTTALTLWRIGAPLAEQMESFQAEETMGSTG
jgi:hypothetical protein